MVNSNMELLTKHTSICIFISKHLSQYISQYIVTVDSDLILYTALMHVKSTKQSKCRGIGNLDINYTNLNTSKSCVPMGVLYNHKPYI